MVTEEELAAKLTEIGSLSKNTWAIIGDLNARSKHWDRIRNRRGKAVEEFSTANRGLVTAPDIPSFHSKSGMGSSNPDIMI